MFSFLLILLCSFFLAAQVSAEEGDFAAQFVKLDNTAKVQALAGIVDRKEKQYLSLALDSLKSSDANVKRAAVLAVGKLGTEEQVPVLLEIGVPFDRDLTVTLLSSLVGDQVDEILLARLKAATKQDDFTVLADILTNRYNRAALEPIFAFAGKASTTNRLELLKFAERIARKKDVGSFVDVYLLITEPRGREGAEQIIAGICAEDATPILPRLQGDLTPRLLPLIGRIGGEEAQQAVQKSLESKNPTVHAAAVRAFANWPNAVVGKTLITIANDEKELQANRIAALRAYIRVMTLPEQQIGIEIDDQEKLTTLKKLFGTKIRKEEKQLILQRLSAVRTVESAKFILEQYDNPDYTAIACKSLLDLAHHNFLRRQDKELFGGILDKIIATSKDKSLVERAKRYKNEM